MKNSIKFLSAASLLLLASLTGYNAALRAEYRLGTFKDPLRNYTALPLTNFSTLDVPAAGLLRVKIEVGPYAVYVSKDAAKYLKVSQQGAQITVALNYPEKETWLGRGEALIIRCPRLNALTAGATYTLAGHPQTQMRLGYPAGNEVVIKGFAQDSLRLVQDNSARIVLVGNRLGQLQAEVGTTQGSGSTLRLEKDNRIQSANLSIEHQSHLELESAIPQLRYQFSDSATAAFSGMAARRLGQ